MDAPNKREILEAIIENEEEPWIIIKPSRRNPSDSDPVCIFENPAELTQATVEIPMDWFKNRATEKIREAVQTSLRSADTNTSLYERA